MKSYTSEIEGQKKFFEMVHIEPNISHSTDGVYKGCLFENKLDIPNLNKVLYQAIKYASRIRIRGERLPAKMFLNDLNREVAYIFSTIDLLSDIEKVYFGAASKGNEEFFTNVPHLEIEYSNIDGLQQLINQIRDEKYTDYHIDRFNIVGLSIQFYKQNQNKDIFINGENAEIRIPNILKYRIIPYSKKDNLEFEDIMDLLNPGLLQREQGAYYTHPAYVKEMHIMLHEAIDQVPEGMDYVIIDRCAGTGNLQEGLSDEILKHCILSTIELNEYLILSYKYGDICQVVVPNTDALSYDIIPANHNEQGVADEYIREKVNDKNCVVILVENPPYSESGSGAAQNTGKKENLWKKSYVIDQMRNEYKGVVLNDLSNLFIWSGFKYYLTKETDSFFLFSPTKYWRNQNLVNKFFSGGFLCNRQAFHATQKSAIGCIWWKNIIDKKTESINLKPYDTFGDSVKVATDTEITIRKAYHNLSEAYDNRKFLDDSEDGLICEKDGREFLYDGKKLAISKPLFNKNIIGYIQADSFTIDRKTVKLVRGALYNGHGFYLRSDNFIEKLPLFVAASFPYDKWYFTDVYSKSYDGQGKHLDDNEFLKRCLIYSSLTPKNKCRSMFDRNGRFYRNELCFDGEDTLAWLELQSFQKNRHSLSDAEQTLIKYWKDVLFEAIKTEEYKKRVKDNSEMRFGFWQIMDEFNTKIDSGRLDKKGNPIMVYKYVTLNTEINKLTNELKQYYAKDIIPLLFKYELIK